MNVRSAAYNGLAWGSSTSIKILTTGGFDDLPVVRSDDTDRANDDGSIAGTDRLGSRTVEFALRLSADNQTALDVLVESLKAATIKQATQIPLSVNGTRRLYCRPRRRAFTDRVDGMGKFVEAVVQFTATNPRLYDETLTTLTAGLPTLSGGMSFPFGFPLGFGAASTGGYMTAVNAGNYPTRATATILGPVTNPKIEQVTTGQYISFALTLASAETLVIDFDARTAKLNGTADRRSLMTSLSEWWELPPGNNTLRFSGGTYDAAALLTLTFRSAWV